MFPIAAMKSFGGGHFIQSQRAQFVDSAIFEVTCPYRGKGKKAHTQGSLQRFPRQAGPLVEMTLGTAVVQSCSRSVNALAIFQKKSAASLPFVDMSTSVELAKCMGLS